MKDGKPSAGIFHQVPKDLDEILRSNQKLLKKWNDLTPIMRNEWICWVINVKKQQTRDNHLKRLYDEIIEGKRNPCCWPGCPHRNPNAKKWFNTRRILHD